MRGEEDREYANLVRENHQPPVGLPPQYAPDALSGITHRIESQELRFPDTVCVTKILKTSLKKSSCRHLSSRQLVYIPSIFDFPYIGTERCV